LVQDGKNKEQPTGKRQQTHAQPLREILLPI
jgi:hypothetical protein